ncbi:pyridoxal phosphate-dependent aminotransferase [Amycolatopsis sp.]|uniref:pyridoxal phosphate-dependent aminotransferase n=1 Tax=Amycolatopsis sp. TaxID=37632 RepID=UPI002D7F1A3A|nr:pyridoxal phosphate-dependent aminotransferase [Amycolatopsis sp.]HET6711180.1 pyridoxal phosphate-dependent aminotransferase [Amycolatopsis sp.]
MDAGHNTPPRDGAAPADRVRHLPGGELVALLREGRAKAVVDLAAGTPGAPRTPDVFVEAAHAALRDGRHQYEDPAGNLALRERIARTAAVGAAPETELTVTVGATEALCVAMLATVNPGDEVVVLEPFFENFLGAVALAGGIPRFVPMRHPDWRFDPVELAAAFGPRTRAILVNTPNNPSGRVFERAELEVIAELCRKWNATVISDEVYASYTFDGHRHVSAADLPGLRGRAIVLGSFSKSHAVSGWRLGFLRADPERTRVLRAVHVSVAGCAATPLQHAVAHAAPDVGNVTEEMAQRRDRVLAMFSGIGLDCTRSEGGCYVMADIRPVTAEDSPAFVAGLVERTGVLIVPGVAFFGDRSVGERFVRIAVNRSAETLEKAANLLAGGRNDLRPSRAEVETVR